MSGILTRTDYRDDGFLYKNVLFMTILSLCVLHSLILRAEDTEAEGGDGDVDYTLTLL